LTENIGFRIGFVVKILSPRPAIADGEPVKSVRYDGLGGILNFFFQEACPEPVEEAA
jgi:hypothetical protein